MLLWMDVYIIIYVIYHKIIIMPEGKNKNSSKSPKNQSGFNFS